MDPNSRLSSLAIDALGDYVSSLCLKCVELNLKNVDNTVHKSTCKQLKELLCSNVPPSLVNEVTCRLLRRLDALHANLCNSLKYPWCVEIINEIVKSVLHPSITRLNFAPDCWHEWSYGFDWDFIPLFVYQNVGVLHKLKQIRLSKLRYLDWEDCNLETASISPCLEEFTFMFCCTNRILETIAHSCPKLKCLNIIESVYISDTSIDSILKFHYLEQLNVEKTSISETGIAKLLSGLTKNQVSGYGYSWSAAAQLLRFGCSEATSSHLHALVQKFPNLVALNLVCDRKCNLLILRELENLKVLQLSYVEFPQIGKLLVALGRQLQFLDICDVGPINAKIIGETCSSLKCLHITSSDTSSIPAAEDFMSPLPGFQSVTCLCLHLEYNPETVQYVLCQCINVRRVDVTIGIGNDNVLIDNVLSQNPLKYLEEFNWWSWSSSKLTQAMSRQIVEHCPSLTILRGPYVWLKLGNVWELCKNVAKLMFFEPQILC